MAYYKPIKGPSSFINDDTGVDLIQLSPVRRPYIFEQVNKNTTTANQVSRTNFIENSLVPSDRPRALVITNTGEKHPVDPDDSVVPKASLNPFIIRSPRMSSPTMERISEKSSSLLSLAEKPNKKHCIKKPINRHKYRLLCTPRNIERASSCRLLLAKPKNDKLDLKVQQNASIETQTENNSSVGRSFDLPKQYHKARTPIVASSNYKSMGDTGVRYEKPKRLYNTAPIVPPPMEPLKIYTKNDYNLTKYSELRNLASALTLITIISWLFSTFFDVECLWNYLNSWWEYFCNWLLPHERPKTKVEIFITFLQDMWS